MPELDELHASIINRLRQVVAALDGLTEAHLNAMPTVEGTNSPYVLAAHTLGNARAYILGIALSQDISRDRPGEFVSSGADAAPLRAYLDRLEGDMATGLGGLTSADLDKRILPPEELWGPNNPVREITVRRALIQVIEHASLHLGHLELTRDLIGPSDRH